MAILALAKPQPDIREEAVPFDELLNGALETINLALAHPMVL